MGLLLGLPEGLLGLPEGGELEGMPAGAGIPDEVVAVVTQAEIRKQPASSSRLGSMLVKQCFRGMFMSRVRDKKGISY